VKGRHKLRFLGLLWIEYGILTREKKRLKTFHSDDGPSLNVVYQTHLVVFKSWIWMLRFVGLSQIFPYIPLKT
jgi:hypothetical protein